MSTIDEQIRGLFAKLEVRKAKVAELKATIARSWVTNGTFRLIGASSTTNLQTANVQQIEEIATHLCIFRGARAEAATRLRPMDDKQQGYTVDQWFEDLAKRLAAIDIREEEKQLEILEQRLNSVLSPEARRQIEVELLLKEV